MVYAMNNSKSFVKVICGLSALMLFVMGIVNTEVIITFPGGDLLILFAGILLLLGLFLPVFTGWFSAVCRWVCSITLAVCIVFSLTVLVGVFSHKERTWESLEVVGYKLPGHEHKFLRRSSYLLVHIDGQRAFVEPYDKPLDELAERYGKDFNDSILVNVTAKEVVPHIYVKPHATIIEPSR